MFAATKVCPGAPKKKSKAECLSSPSSQAYYCNTGDDDPIYDPYSRLYAHSTANNSSSYYNNRSNTGFGNSSSLGATVDPVRNISGDLDLEDQRIQREKERRARK
jgi:hypothetical protein